jgi:hypothetical protein
MILQRGVKILRLVILLGLAVFALRSAVTQFQDVRAERVRQGSAKDPATGWEDRLRLLRDDLPKSGPIGYVSEENIPGLAFSAVDSDEEFALTQYVLAPHVLVRGAVLEYTIGNINLPDANPPDLKAVFGVRESTSYGMGIYLFRKAAP